MQGAQHSRASKGMVVRIGEGALPPARGHWGHLLDWLGSAPPVCCGNRTAWRRAESSTKTIDYVVDKLAAAAPLSLYLVRSQVFELLPSQPSVPSLPLPPSLPQGHKRVAIARLAAQASQELFIKPGQGR